MKRIQVVLQQCYTMDKYFLELHNIYINILYIPIYPLYQLSKIYTVLLLVFGS